MTVARASQVSLEDTSYYHCYVRCVRRAYLCGSDHVSGENFDHRKQWIVSRLRFLSYVYAIDVCAYAIMDNHYHTVLHVDAERAKSWPHSEVVERWMQLYNGHTLVDQWLAGCKQVYVEPEGRVLELIETWRERLYDISWFMRGVNETIARMANEEEGVKGRFWEGRFKSQALLDEAAQLSCMVYVDLNPVRAAIESDVVTSDFTSIQQRIYDYAQTHSDLVEDIGKLEGRIEKQRAIKEELELDKLPEAPLMAFSGSSHIDIHQALPFTLQDYFDLVDVTGRLVRSDKRGSVDAKLPALVNRLGIDPDKWLDHVKAFGNQYGACAGSVTSIRDYAHRHNRKWSKGVAAASRVYLRAG
ncbi:MULTISPECIES: transposase [unclassified Marinobacterium]|uniref:transposase n=1 Tax=unclassified Marinobacterium TaxID=2644139 RepID=UPI0019E3694E|nr:MULTISPECIES: transposase [unclassified Marinobacterium]NRP53646.1 hypothetical protein [Marinobacterium sp. xm-v-242]NRP77896.1 hypothetical protein [Marinobacterium sp. xm-m-383]